MKRFKSHRERKKRQQPQPGTRTTNNDDHNDAGNGAAHKPVKDEALRYNYRPNWLLIVSLLVLSAVLAGGSFLLRRYQLARHAEVYRTRAYAAHKQGQLPQALTWMRRYLRFNPSDVDALADFGTWVEKSASDGNSYFFAFLTYESVLRKTPERHDLRRKLVDVAMILGRHADALHHLEILLNSSPQETELIGKSAVCEAGLGHYAKAIGLYRQAIDLEPQKLDWYWGLVQLARAAKAELRPADLLPQTEASPPNDQSSEDGERASAPGDSPLRTFDELLQDWLARMVERGQPKWRALLLRSQFYLELGKVDAAETDLAAARQLNPDVVDIDMQLAQIKLQRAEQSREAGRLAEAEELTHQALAIVEKAVQDNPSDARLYIALAQILLTLNRLDDAEKIIREGLQRCTAQMNDAQTQEDKPQLGRLNQLQSDLYFLLADVLINRINDAGDVAQLTKEIEELLSQATKYGLTEVRQNFLRGRLLFTQRAWRQAQEVLESLRSQVESMRQLRQRTDLLLGQCAEMLQNPDERVRIYRRALASDPAWLLGRLQLADSLAKAGLVREAMDHYRAMINVRGVSAALAALLIGEQLRLAESERQWQPVRNFLREAAAREPDSSMIVIRQAQVATFEGKFDEAQRLLDAARERFADEIVVWEASVRMVLARTDWDLKDRRQAAEELLLQAEQRFGDRVELRLAQAAAVNDLPQPEQDTALQQLGQQVDQFAVVERVRLWDGLAQIALQLGKTSLAQSFWEQAAAAEPMNLGPRLALANLAIERRDRSALAELATAVRAIEGHNGPHGLYLEASGLLLSLEDAVNLRQEPLSSSNRDLERAVDLLRQVSQQRPLWPVPHAMLGELAYHVGDRQSAVEHFRRARGLGDSSPRVLTRLVTVLTEVGRKAEADAELQKALTSYNAIVAPELARMAWQIAWHKGDLSSAEHLAQQVAASTNDVRDLLWVSLLREVRAKPASEVEEPLRKAVELSPKNPSAWRNLIRYMARTGRHSEARQTLATALSQLPPEPAYVKLVFEGECLEILGSPDEAQRLYEKALATNPAEPRLRVVLADFLMRRGDYAASQPHLHYLSDAKNNIPKFIAEWALARMAANMALTGSYTDVERALKLLGETSNDDKLTRIYRLRGQVNILLVRSTWRDRTRLIEVLEQLSSLDVLTPSERYLLGSCYFHVRKREKALEIFRRLVQEDNQRAEWVSALVRTLLERDSRTAADVNTAAQWIDHLIKHHPESVLTRESRLRLSAATDSTEQAKIIVNDFLGTIASQPDPTVTVRELARLCAELKLDQAAESVYQWAIQHGHETDVLADYIRFLTYRGRVEDAVHWLNVARETNVGGGSWARLVTALLISNDLQQPKRAELERWVLDAVSKYPDTTDSQLALAELHIARGQVRDAIAVYRQLLSREPRNVIALNNLAWILALHRLDIPQAIELVKQAIDLAGPHAALLDTRGLAYLAAGRCDEAITDFQEAIENQPSATIRLHLAKAYWTCGRSAEARSAYQEAVKEGLVVERLPLPERSELADLIRILQTPPTPSG